MADPAFSFSRFRFGSEGGIPEWGLLFQCLFYRCIVDEAHIIRNPATRISNAVAKLDAVYRWLLTGCVPPLAQVMLTDIPR